MLPDAPRRWAPQHVAPSLVLASGMTLLIAWSVARGLARGFVAISDDAQIALRARDVLTEHHPLVGMASSGSTPDAAFNHPGPLLFDLLALPVRVLGDGVGVAVGAALINVVAVWGTVLAARRLAGELAATVVAAGVCALGWAMGSEVLYSVWNPNVVVLAFVWFAVCCWGVACGRWAFVPRTVGIGSLCAQSQLGYPLAVALALAAALVIGWVWPSHRTTGEERWRWLGIGTVVFVACWAQPLWEQFTSEGRGNISLIVSAGGDATGTVGVGFASRILADVLLPGSWFRPEFDRVWFRDGGLPSTALSVLVILLVVVAAGGWVATVARRRAPDVARLLAIVGAVFVGGFLTMVRVPASFGVAVPSYFIRWSVAGGHAAARGVRAGGVLGGFCRAALVERLVGMVARRGGRSGRRRLAARVHRADARVADPGRPSRCRGRHKIASGPGCRPRASQGAGADAVRHCWLDTALPVRGRRRARRGWHRHRRGGAVHGPNVRCRSGRGRGQPRGGRRPARRRGAASPGQDAGVRPGPPTGRSVCIWCPPRVADGAAHLAYGSAVAGIKATVVEVDGHVTGVDHRGDR